MTQDLHKTQTRRRRGAAFWRRTFLAQKNSGLSPSKFCRRNDLPVSTFYAWRRRLHGTSEETTSEVEFVEVQTSAAAVPEASDEDGFELVFPNGLRLKMPSQIEGRELAEVLWALQVAGSC